MATLKSVFPTQDTEYPLTSSTDYSRRSTPQNRTGLEWGFRSADLSWKRMAAAFGLEATSPGARQLCSRCPASRRQPLIDDRMNRRPRLSSSMTITASRKLWRGLFESVGLSAETHGSVKEFIAADDPKKRDASSSISAFPGKAGWCLRKRCLKATCPGLSF